MKYKKLLVLTIIFFILAFQSVNAQEVTPDMPHVSPTSAPIQYALPYPGILPGHPLYFFKDIRDTVVGFFIANPLKRAEYALLQSDKNLQAARALSVQKKDYNIILETVKKSGDYFENAIKKSEEAKQQGMGTKDFLTRLALAGGKHQEILVEMITLVQGEDKKQLIAQLNRAKKMGKDVNQLNSK